MESAFSCWWVTFGFIHQAETYLGNEMAFTMSWAFPSTLCRLRWLCYQGLRPRPQAPVC